MEKGYIINISFIIEPPVHGQWYEFVTHKFLPFIREREFGKMIFTRVLTDDNNAHYTYSLQITDSSVADYRRFMDEVIGEYNGVAGPWFAEKALHYVSLLKIIEIE